MDDIFKKRKSTRSYQKKIISEKDVESILAAANSAPSAGNLKAREVLIISDSDIKKKIADSSYGQAFVASAPLLLIFFALPSVSAQKYDVKGETLYSIQDATIAAAFAWIQAVMLGIDACWVGGFDEQKVKDVLGIADDKRPVCIMPFGYGVNS